MQNFLLSFDFLIDSLSNFNKNLNDAHDGGNNCQISASNSNDNHFLDGVVVHIVRNYQAFDGYHADQVDGTGYDLEFARVQVI